MNLLSPGTSNAKLSKNGEGIESTILYMIPAHGVSEALGRRVTVCPWADACVEPCLVKAGRGQQKSVQAGRLRKTLAFFQDRPQFMAQLSRELKNLEKRARKKGKRAVARLDGTSDLGLAKKLAPQFSGITFYDYTKSVKRISSWLDNPTPNYHLTLSRSNPTQWASECIPILNRGGTVSAVFTPEIFKMVMADGWWEGFPVIDGTKDDWRWQDAPGSVVALSFKGSNRNQSIGIESGFVIDSF